MFQKPLHHVNRKIFVSEFSERSISSIYITYLRDIFTAKKKAFNIEIYQLNGIIPMLLQFMLTTSENNLYNLGQNICRLLHFLAQFAFTTSETELDWYHQKVNTRVASQVVERPKTQDLRKLGSYKKIHEMFGFNGEYPAVHPKVS